MIWQDIVIALANTIFIFSLSEQIYEILKLKVSTLSLINTFTLGVGLSAISFAMFTLDLYFSSIVTGLNALLWFVIGFLTIKYREKE
ncbi:MAG: hypothetical protein LAT82_00960 [Nanoarchaeota archaeon]|nr:hypothetical protein [Nanoarchaeota archaeon]